MTVQNQEYVAGWRTTADWHAAKSTLVHRRRSCCVAKSVRRIPFEPGLNFAISLQSRSFKHSEHSWEKDSRSLPIQCSLIEFLESTVQGLKYRYERDPAKLEPHEYSSSSKIFASFLTTRNPFAAEFNSQLAVDFYSSVRCGLLHEART